MVAGTTPVQKVEKSYGTILAFYILFCLTVLIKFIHLYPQLDDTATKVAIGIDSLTLFLQICLSFFSPGYLDK